MKPALLLCLCLLLATGSTAQPSEPDSLRHVFRPLDGEWQGTFIVYHDVRGQTRDTSQARDISLTTLKRLPLEEVTRIQVRQVYRSETPFYQEVSIWDTYERENGQLDTVKSTGYNQVKDGTLICVVNKPDEQVIHQGQALPGHVILWERSLSAPLKIEFFRETVDEQTYTIVGWGYYGEDDPGLSPKTWFYGLYHRL